MKTDKKLNSIISMALILFFGLMSASVTHAETYTFVKEWGFYGSDDGQFSNPCGVAVDSSDNVYIADSSNYRIQKFDDDGTFLAKWGSEGSGDGQFIDPLGIDIDSLGNVYVVDAVVNHRIQKFDSDGNYLTQWGSYGSGDGQFEFPFSVAIDSKDNVYVADKNNNRIQKFDSNGAFIAQWGSPGSQDGQFNNPIGVAVDPSGNVYVCDTNNYRIQKFDDDGTFITKWGSYGNGDGQFIVPRDVAIDSLGNVYVVDSRKKRIQKFDDDGTFITKWGSSGSGNGQFYNPYGVAVDSSGNVYITDWDSHRIQKFALEKKITPAIIWSNPADITFETALSSTQLNAVATDPASGATIDGTFTYNPAAGTFLSVGTHTLHVDFTPIDAANYSNASKNVTINVLEKPVLPVANFSANITSGYAPLSVQFIDLSKNVTKWKWTFGDGTNSTLQNPTHKYSKAGNYTVSLTASNSAGNNTKTRTNYIKVAEKPVANFTSNVTSGYPPLSVQFIDLSKNVTKWKWSFGDGTNSTLQNPTHKYSKAGNYTVALTASNFAGNNTKTRTNYIKVKPFIKPVAKFTSNVTSGRAPLTVSFTDKSTNNPTSWKWTFGDGTNSPLQNSTHRYLVQGNYTVKLIVANKAGNNSTTKINYIKVTPTNTKPGA